MPPSAIEVTYGGNKTWMNVSPSDHFTATDRRLIEGVVERGVGYTIEFTLTRVKLGRLLQVHHSEPVVRRQQQANYGASPLISNAVGKRKTGS